MIYIARMDPAHKHNVRLKVIDDHLNALGRFGLTQAVLFHGAAKRKMVASSLVPSSALMQSLSLKQVGPRYLWGADEY